MPDMQSELLRALEEGKRRFLQSTINDWDNHEQTIRQPQSQTQTQPTPEKTVHPLAKNLTEALTITPHTIVKTGNLSRDVFKYVQQGLFTRIQVADAMSNVGYVRKSASSIVTQMLKSGMLALHDGRLVTTIPEYAPVANPTKPVPPREYIRRKPLNIKSREAKPKQAAGLAALKETKAEPAQAPVQEKPARLVRMQTAAEVIANMSVIEAHKLYVELGKMFGNK